MAVSQWVCICIPIKLPFVSNIRRLFLLVCFGSLTSIDTRLMTTFGRIVRGSRNPFHDFKATYTLLCKGGTSRDPAFPHIIGITCDTLAPDDRILRSELLLAVCILRRTHATNPCLEHHTVSISVKHVVDSSNRS